MEDAAILEDVFLFRADGESRRGAIAFNSEGILALGERDAVRARAAKGARGISLPGALVLPGFCDGHTHMLAGSLQLVRINLRSVKGREDFSANVARWVAQNPSLPWVLGEWADSSLGGNLPTREWVDDASRGKPLFLVHFDMHSALANTRALEIAGVLENSPDPPGGRIVRDPRSSRPTGLLLEKAMDLVAACIPRLPEAEKAKALRKGFALAESLGITQVHDVISRWEDLKAYRAALREGAGLKVFARVPLYDLDRLLSALEEGPSGRLVLDGVKGFVDGSLGSSTAWLEEPYAHDPASTGIFRVEDPGGFRGDLRRAARAGVSVSLHAIGDAAIGFALDIFHEIIAENPYGPPLRIEHFQHPGKRHIERMGHPRLFASIQPAHLLDDAGPAEERLGLERAALSYPIRSLLERNCPVLFGSDWDVAELNPLVGLQAAVNRVDKEGRFPGGWHPEQRVSISRAIECCTATGARATRMPQRSGRLEPGMQADLTVLDRDITSIPPEEISRAKAIMTVISGKIAHQA